MVAAGVKAKKIDAIYVKFSDGVYEISGVTVMETADTRDPVIILDVNPRYVKDAVADSFFS